MAGKAVVTIEGLHPKGEHPVQVAWRNLGVPAMRLLPDRADHAGRRAAASKPAPTDDDITDAMSGNLCRCGCYQRIHAAVRAAAKGA